jgi:hypothetical protein
MGEKITVIWDKLSCKILHGINNPDCNTWDQYHVIMDYMGHIILGF